MFFGKKETIYLGSFIRVVTGAIIQANEVIKTKINDFFNGSASKGGGSVSIEEMERIKEEALWFRLVCLMFMLLEVDKFGKKRFDSEELGKIFATAVCLAFQDNGISQEEASQMGEKLVEVIQQYGDSLSQVQAQELESKGTFFHLIKIFADLMTQFDTSKLMDSSARASNFLVFDLGKQIYRIDEKVFKDYFKKVKFLDE